jgi:hypothetical protein
MGLRQSVVSSWSELIAETTHSLQHWPWLDTLRTLRQRFREDHLGLTASSLTFTTTIALVPLVTVMLALFSAFPMFGSFQAALEKYFVQSLVPESIAKPVLQSLTQFIAGQPARDRRFGGAGVDGNHADADDRSCAERDLARSHAAADCAARPRLLGRGHARAAAARRQPELHVVCAFGVARPGVGAAGWCQRAARRHRVRHARPGHCGSVLLRAEHACTLAARHRRRRLVAFSFVSPSGRCWYLAQVPGYSIVYEPRQRADLPAWVYCVWAIVCSAPSSPPTRPACRCAPRRRPRRAASLHCADADGELQNARAG